MARTSSGVRYSGFAIERIWFNENWSFRRISSWVAENEEEEDENQEEREHGEDGAQILEINKLSTVYTHDIPWRTLPTASFRLAVQYPDEFECGKRTSASGGSFAAWKTKPYRHATVSFDPMHLGKTWGTKWVAPGCERNVIHALRSRENERERLGMRGRGKSWVTQLTHARGSRRELLRNLNAGNSHRVVSFTSQTTKINVSSGVSWINEMDERWSTLRYWSHSRSWYTELQRKSLVQRLSQIPN